MIFRIAAYGNWWVYLDGSLIKQGNGHQQADDISIKPTCGKHVLKIKVVKTIADDWAGLTYLLQQDQSDCKCDSNKWWNPYKCGCECLHKCDCPDHKVWSSSRCACICKPRRVSSGITAVKAIAICPSGQYYSPTECKCMCYPRWCPEKTYYNTIPEKGECRCWPLG